MIQIDPEDLQQSARDRIGETLADSPLPVDVLRQNHGIEPAQQIELAKEILGDLKSYATKLTWRGYPKKVQLRACCNLIWDHWVGHGRSMVFSAEQLVWKIWDLRNKRPIAERIQQELTCGQYAAKTASEAVERVLKFDRNWANFDFPQYLMALHRIQQALFGERRIRPGDYSFFAKQVESLFRPEICAALDEYGIPSSVAEKCPFLSQAKDLDTALEALVHYDLSSTALHPYELELLTAARDGLVHNA